MRVAIALDRWKLPTFNVHLEAAGVQYVIGDGLTPDTAHLYIEIDEAYKQVLALIIKEANDDAKRTKAACN